MHSRLKLFADDAKLYSSVAHSTGQDQLQTDLDALCSWTQTWLLPFNVAKCSTIHLGTSNPRYSYRILGTTLSQEETEKDLGVLVDHELKFRKQAAAAASKANQVLGLVKHSFAKVDRQTLPLLYKTLVRPHIEYGNAIWGPFFKEDQKLIERVQRRATKLVQDICHLPYQERL